MSVKDKGTQEDAEQEYQSSRNGWSVDWRIATTGSEKNATAKQVLVGGGGGGLVDCYCGGGCDCVGGRGKKRLMKDEGLKC